MEPASAARQILRLGRAFAQSRMLHSAVEVGVFDLLADGPASEAEICGRLQLDIRLSTGLLDALVALGLLDRTGSGQYRNTLAAAYLVTGAPGYLGDALQAAAADYGRWARLTQALRPPPPTGSAADPPPDPPSGPPAEAAYRPPGVRTLTGLALARGLDWLRYADFVELGGRGGEVAGQIAAMHPHLRSRVVDRPEHGARFAEHMALLGTADRVRFRDGDPLAGPIPEVDVVIFGPLSPALPAARLRQVLELAYRAARRGGALLLYGLFADQPERDPYVAASWLNARLTCPVAACCTVGELRELVAGAGFAVERVQDLDAAAEDRLLVGRKPEG
jgi:hypothetical protein